MRPGRNYDAMTGRRFGRLTVVSVFKKRYYSNGCTKAFVKCQCECGNVMTATAQKVFEHRTISCGCAKTERAKLLNPKRYGPIGAGLMPEYRSWQSMKDRCLHTTHKSYADYGGKGIRICDRWLSGFANFYADMGKRPPHTTLDRINGHGDYEPGNCRWASDKQQQRNRTNIKREMVCGHLLCASEASEHFGLPKWAVKNRLHRNHYSIETAILRACADYGLVGPTRGLTPLKARVRIKQQLTE